MEGTGQPSDVSFPSGLLVVTWSGGAGREDLSLPLMMSAVLITVAVTIPGVAAADILGKCKAYSITTTSSNISIIVLLMNEIM